MKAKNQRKQLRLIGFLCKAKDLNMRINEEWKKIEKMKRGA